MTGHWLDQVVALSKGYDVPYGGIFRSEPCEIVREEGNQLIIRFPNYSDPNKEFLVDHSCVGVASTR